MIETQQRLAVRAGAGAAILGALLGTVVNLAHGDLPDDPKVALTRIAETPLWSLLHLGIILSVLLVLIAILGLSRAASGDGAQLLVRTAASLALPGAAVSMVVTTIDGIATKAMADSWAVAASSGATGSASDPALLFADAVAVEAIQNALFHAEAALFFGLPFLLLGLSAQLPGGGLPRRSGWLAVLGGGGSLVFGLAGLAGQELPGLLFNGFAGLITLWALVTGVLVWRRPPVLSVPTEVVDARPWSTGT